ncbi:methionyl-tRNA formyltransferase [Shewanella algae]|uniref:methionyl-tRNA formyltransferase n=1 Tax=Shewanella algae TaxID=38313 RepID=UPI001183357A|nr:formyltransferase family protein [Shewanella algae]TVO82159.1 formyl transferase [Shewanella algae]TVO83297.1 formyl transferase [Shewanella algae]TVO87700.1 formyl transferase [Shewanella algae]TVO94625.1 formyl transferase [Shewanella algae]TXS85029.1 formyl transferase [Shewanella algae]
MKVVVITQDDPFYLAKNLDYLFGNLPDNVEVVSCIVSKVSPFGKKESFIDKALKTYNIFGFNFFINYALKFILSKLSSENSVKFVLKKHKITELVLNESINSKNSLSIIRQLEPDLLVSIAGNEIFKKPLINIAPQGCLNLHTALLPKYRGLMPSFWVLKNQEAYTGVSVFFVDEGIDSGPIHVQKKIEIGSMTQAELIKVSKRIGMDAIIESIEKIIAGDKNVIDNDDSEMSYFKFPSKEDVKVFKANGKKFF